MPISIPKFFQRAFAQNGSKQNVPITGDTSGGRASYDVGFPPVTRVPIVAGGIPPFGTDFNGVLYDLSQAIQYLQSGVTFPFDQDFANAIGGYSVKAIVADPSDPTILWQNNNANNTLPPSVPNGWTQVFSSTDLLRDPTTSLRGAPLQATKTQAESGTDNAAMITSLRLREAFNASGSAPVYACRAWVNFNGTGTLSIRDSGNVSSVTDNGTGDYTINLATAMPDTNYGVYVSFTPVSIAAGNVFQKCVYVTILSSSQINVVCNSFQGSTNTLSREDFPMISVMVVG